MNEQEKQVVQAAIRMWHRMPGMDAGERIALSNATRDLIHNCDQCNTDTHRCFGCGINLEHGDETCSRCDEELEGQQ